MMLFKCPFCSREMRLALAPGEEGAIPQGEERDPERIRLEAIPIEQMEFSVRTYNCLKSQGIRTVGHLIDRSPQELLRIKHFGKLCLEQVITELGTLNLTLSAASRNGRRI